MVTVFVAGIEAQAHQAGAAGALINFLQTGAAREVLRAKGLDPLDRCFRPCIEQVQAGRVHGELQPVVHFHAQRRVDARDEGRATDPRVEHDFRSQLLDHLDFGLEAEVVGVGWAGEMDVLWPDAQGGVGSVAAVGAAGDRV